MEATRELKRERVVYVLAPHLTRLIRVDAAQRKLRAANVVAEIVAAHYGVPVEQDDDASAG